MLGFQSSYTILDNAIHLNELKSHILDSGYDFFCYADTNLYAMHQVYKTFEKTHIKAVVGLVTKINDHGYRNTFNIYPMSQQGYENLLKVSFILEKNNEIDVDVFYHHIHGLAVVLNPNESDVTQSLIKEDAHEAHAYLDKYKSKIKNFYIGLSVKNDLFVTIITPAYMKISKGLSIPVLPLHETKYIKKEDVVVYDVIRKINQKMIVKDDGCFYDKNEIETKFVKFSDVFQTLENFKKILNFTYQLPIFNMPNPPTNHLAEAKIYLESLAKMGLKKRLEKVTISKDLIETYTKRLDYELKTIIHMGFSEYFLIVYDFVKYAKQNQILVGPGRGSAAGSLVSYCLGITDVDPIQYDLLFERFLNPERISMPDIDLDFPDYRREEVIEYVGKTYGYKHVASIQTFQTFSLKSSIRDVVKVLDLDHTRIEGIIQSVINQTIDESDHDVVLLDYIVKRLEGIPRQTGTHAAGIILAKEDLSVSIPLREGQFSFPQTQYEMGDLKSLGLLKIDFLGIKNLSIIESILKLVNHNQPIIHLNEIPLNDSKTYELLKKGETTGVFQLESSGIRQVLRKIEPSEFEDIVATLALYRPGPMESIDVYVRQKKLKKMMSIDPSIDHILKHTYGIIIYQEQIMQIANVFAGYNLAQADLLRRGISEKSVVILESERQKFIEKAVSLGRSEVTAKEIYELIVKFADYGFNRSHSVAYGLIAYQMAYLKANYYLAFMSILLSNVIGNESQTLTYIQEVKNHKIKIYNPDLFESATEYMPYKDGLIMPLSVIKGIGVQTARMLVENRNQLHKTDFIKCRVALKEFVNERQFESLIHADALSHFKLNHQTMLSYKDVKTIGFDAYISDFKMTELEELSKIELSNFEKEVLGFNNRFDLLGFLKSQKSIIYDDFSEDKNNLLVMAYYVKHKEIKTKKGDLMAFVTFSDGSYTFDVTLFSEDYLKFKTSSVKGVYSLKLRKNVYKNTISWQTLYIKRELIEK